MNFDELFFFVPRRFMVDWIPIRVYRNHADKGVGFPRWQPMSIKVSLWNGDSWATNGGRDKIDWSKGPFIASFGNYKIDACVWKGNARFCRADSSTNWWNKERFSSLTSTQRRYFKWVRKYHLIYDYCQDNQRFQNKLPKECSLPKYWPKMRQRQRQRHTTICSLSHTAFFLADWLRLATWWTYFELTSCGEIFYSITFMIYFISFVNLITIYIISFIVKFNLLKSLNP